MAFRAMGTAKLPYSKRAKLYSALRTRLNIFLRADLAPAWDAMTEVGKLLASEKGDHHASAR